MAVCQKWAKMLYVQGVATRHTCSTPRFTPDKGAATRHIGVCVSPCPAVQQQKLFSSHWFGALKASIPACTLLRRSVFFTDAGRYVPYPASKHVSHPAPYPLLLYVYVYVYVYVLSIYLSILLSLFLTLSLYEKNIYIYIHIHTSNMKQDGPWMFLDPYDSHLDARLERDALTVSPAWPACTESILVSFHLQ